MDFYQDPPILTNTFSADPLLAAYLKKNLPPEFQKHIFQHLESVGEKAAGPWACWSRGAELNPPVHIPYSAWGKRIDDIQLSEGWRKLEAAASEEGIVASGYERKQGEWSRVYQAALLYLFHPSSAFVSCPLAMTDGAARAIELYGDDDLKSRAFKHLTSRNPQEAWTSGQWMTERTGGSDVSGTSTVATKQKDGSYALNGVKWFTSATTSQMAMLLARPEGAPEGSKGLSLFYLELRDKENRLRNIEILRLKDKLGTKALPTAELKLHGTPAQLVGGEGSGVRKIASLFNITRVYNSICALGHWRRALQLAQSYSSKRQAFGKKLIDHPLHKATLLHLESEFTKAFKLTFFVAHLLGKDEVGTATENEKVLLRALTPIVKLYTAKKCMEAVSEVVECFGGAGYIEDTGIPTLLRDAQVFSIWEGTTNVLSLDFLRALDKENAGFVMMEVLQKNYAQKLKEPTAAHHITALQKILAEKDRDILESNARALSFHVAEVWAAVL